MAVSWGLGLLEDMAPTGGGGGVGGGGTGGRFRQKDLSSLRHSKSAGVQVSVADFRADGGVIVGTLGAGCSPDLPLGWSMPRRPASSPCTPWIKHQVGVGDCMTSSCQAAPCGGSSTGPRQCARTWGTELCVYVVVAPCVLRAVRMEGTALACRPVCLEYVGLTEILAKH